MADNRDDPYQAYRFKVEIDQIVRAGFSGVSGLSAEVPITEYDEGGKPVISKLPGRPKYSNITLKRGLTDDTYFAKWITDAVKGDIQRRTGSIIVLDPHGIEKVRWNFRDAWPTKVSIGDLAASQNEVIIETVELAVEYVERVS